MAATQQKVRIIGGTWRGIHIEFAPVVAVRPTPNRVRETLFNWLQSDIEGADCLDLFTGSGALGIEAVSRGASYALLVDNDRNVCAQLRKQLVRLKTDQIEVLQMDAYQFIESSTQTYDLIFLDPPFANNDLGKILERVISTGMLNPGGLIYIESALSKEEISIPNGYDWFKFKTISSVSCGLLYETSS